MLPKIVVRFKQERKTFFDLENLDENFVLEIDALETNLREFREWIVFCQNVLDDAGVYSMVIWNAGKLSAECQAVLLKPLEAKKALTRIYLVADKGSDLLPTIVSRCEVVGGDVLKSKEVYWPELVRKWKGGPGQILSYVEKFEVENLQSLLNEVVLKIKAELVKEVNVKRIKILEFALDTLRDVDKTNVNKRMAMESFMLRSWRVIKA